MLPNTPDARYFGAVSSLYWWLNVFYLRFGKSLVRQARHLVNILK